MKKVLKRIFWYIFAVIYFPVYLAAIFCVKIGAFIAVIGYALLHEPITARRILNSMFNKRIYGEF